MTKLNEKIVEEFCELCQWAYEAWITHKTLFDDNPKGEKLKDPFFARLSIITQEYSLQQFIKLHDPAIQNNYENLSFQFVIDNGEWKPETSNKLKYLFNKMENLMGKSIKDARNNVLSHNDLKTILDGLIHGEFPPDADIEYVNLMKEFVNVIHNQYLGGGYAFNDLAKFDAQDLLGKFELNK